MFALIRRRGSLRWRARSALRDVASSGLSVQRLRRQSWSLVGRPWSLPPVALLGVVGLLIFEVSTSPLQVFHEGAARDLLVSIWQVEAAAVALVLTGALFAFESLTRQRPELPLAEYANRSGLSQFFMLAASGLIAIPVVLVSTVGIPVASASFAAALIAFAGLAALPFFFYQAMKVVHPGWLQEERVDHLRMQMGEAVEADVVSRLSFGILADWSNRHEVELGHRYGLDENRLTEIASGPSTVLDINLRSAAKLARENPGQLVILARLGETLWDGAAVLATSDANGARHLRPLTTTSKKVLEDPLPPLLQELHGEANDAIQRGSVRAAEAVAELYKELWLAWPREWERYGQRLQGGLLQDTEPFRLGPTTELRRNLRLQMERAVDQGLRDHADALGGILWGVGLESVKHGAADLVEEMHLLARSFLTVTSQRYSDLADQVRENAWRFQIRILEYSVQDLDDDSIVGSEDQREASVALVAGCIRAVTESLKTLLDMRQLEDFGKLDSLFREVRLPTRFEDQRFFDERVVEDPTATQEEVSRARQRLATADSISDLQALRDAGRLSLLGWAIRADDFMSNERLLIQVRNLSQTVGSIEHLVTAAGVALDYRHTFTSDWVMFDLPEGQAHFIDADGPVLTAIAVVLLSRATIGDIPGSPWMSENRLGRLNSIVDGVVGWDQLWSRIGETEQAVADRADALKKKLVEAEGEQRSQEKLDLIAQPLDESKVELFRKNVREAWTENRVLREFTRLAGIPVSETPESDWGQLRFRINGLDPKGLFVSPSNWVGLDHNASELGRTLALDEIGAIVRLATSHGIEVVGDGDLPTRVRSLLSQTRAAGLKPTLLLVPVHWRLIEALGLRVDPPRGGPGVLKWHVKGEIDGVPVVDWRDVPDDRIYVVDGTRFCEVVEGVGAEGTPSPPAVDIKTISEERARDIVANWETLDSEDAERDRLLDVRSRVERHVSRPYRVDERDTQAVRFIAFDEPKKSRKTASQGESTDAT